VQAWRQVRRRSNKPQADRLRILRLRCPTQTAQSSGNLDTAAPASASPGTAAAQVTTQGALIVIQNGAANAFVVPSGAALDSLATIIQNSVNDQVIRNITTLNITIDAQMLAAQARLNAILDQHGLR